MPCERVIMSLKRIASVICIAFIAGFLGVATGIRFHVTGQSQVSQDRFPNRVPRDEAFEAEWEKLRKANPREFEKRKAGFLLAAQMYLGEFGYGTLITGKPDESTKAALREYQGLNGITATGDLDPRTIDQLMADDKALKQPNGWLPDFLFDADSWNNGYFWARGSWIEEHESKPSPTTTEIQCYRERSLCIEATAYQSIEIFGLGAGFSVNVFPHEIERWDKYEIVTKAEDTPCGRDRMNINRQEKSVTASSAAAYKNLKNCQQLFGPAKTLIMNLRDGKEIHQTHNEATQAAKRRILRMSEEARHVFDLPTR
jgi:hypothetical protein